MKAQILPTVPTFTHDIIASLYKYDLLIDQSILKEILALPRETLLEDLKKALKDLTENQEIHKVYREKRDYSTRPFFTPAMHTLMLLGELEASECFEEIHAFNLFDRELEDNYLLEFGVDEIWYIYYNILNEALIPRYFEVLKEQDSNEYARSTVSKTLVAYLQKHPEKRVEFIGEFRKVFEFYLEHSDSVTSADTAFMGFMLSYLVDCKAIELKDVIKAVHDKEIIDTWIMGSWKDVEKYLEEPERQQIPLNIFDFYTQATKTWHGYKVEKVGRNAPCPCGYGKKYKQCHGKKV